MPARAAASTVDRLFERSGPFTGTDSSRRPSGREASSGRRPARCCRPGRRGAPAPRRARRAVRLQVATARDHQPRVRAEVARAQRRIGQPPMRIARSTPCSTRFDVAVVEAQVDASRRVLAHVAQRRAAPSRGGRRPPRC
jgi:hypothetical protein